MAEEPVNEITPPVTTSTTVATVVGHIEPSLTDKAQVLGALLMVAVALLVVSYVVVMRDNETALGALISIISTGTGFYLRGKVEKQS